MEYRYHCRKCGETGTVEEVMVNAVLISRVTDVTREEDEEVELDYSPTDYIVMNGDVEHYRCTYCGAVICKTAEELADIVNA